YNGDYLVAFKPGYTTTSGASTGSFSQKPLQNEEYAGIDNFKMDYHPATPDWMYPQIQKQAENNERTKTTYNQGDKRNFIVLNITNNAQVSLEFKVTKVGTHCYVWSPTNSSYDPVEGFNPNHPTTIANEFDSKFQFMLNSFGAFADVDGSGKVHLLYYDIIDGATIGSGYVGGYFWGGDMYASINGAAMLHIDTYPSLYYSQGGIDATFSTVIHEFQHLINYSNTAGRTGSWLNEASSMAAEELVYPGSAVPGRIGSYNDKKYMNYHNGKSLYEFDNTLGAYAIACLFGQYLRVHTGDYTVFKRIIDFVADGDTAAVAVGKAVQGSALNGLTLDEINFSFRVALVAKETTGIYGFNGESAFNAIGKMNITSKQTVYSGGAVVIRPTNGIYSVPQDAGNDLIYVGVKNNKVIHDPESIEITNGSFELQIDSSQTLNASILPTGAQPYIAYLSSNSNIVSVSNGIAKAEALGTATITAKTVNGLTDTIQVTVTELQIFHSVRFIDFDGTIISSQSVLHGEGAAAPDNPFREGYTFTGWSEDFSIILADLDIFAEYVQNIIPTIRVEGLTIFADENADKVVIFGIAKGEYSTFAEMTQNGIQYASSAKHFTVDEAGVYTAYLFMNDGYEYFLTANVIALPIPHVVLSNNIVSLDGDTTNVMRMGFALGQYDNLADMVAEGMFFVPRFSFVVKTPGTYTVYILASDGIEYFVKITAITDASEIIPVESYKDEGKADLPLTNNVDVFVNIFKPGNFANLTSIRHRL
ncbi:MAG: InlB B-repeat-containing protein, partial [Clostridiales bacterium]|nr:InlB B-repeat-containing protein [Clostridiales bacterium]